MAQTILHTDRIELVPLADEHFELEVELDSDPEVMRYLWNGGRTREQVTEAHRLRMLTGKAVDGLGFWVGFVEGEFVGWWLLEPPGVFDPEPVLGEAELGYRLLRRRWRQGFAAEGARELLRHAFDDLGLRRVFAQTMAANEASWSTMRAAGLRHVRTFPYDDQLPGFELGGVEYEITADEWQATRQQ